jgi:FkbM family methyltransferase
MERSRLGRMKRFRKCKGKVRGWSLVVPDAASYLSAYREIFVTEIYRFDASKEAPAILDLGANIGLSVLYFKSLYPKALVTAFEADPAIYACLKQNVHENGFGDVELINKAVWDSNGMLCFHAEGGDGGRVAHESDRSVVEVEAIDIRTLLAERSYDFLKMDIEGAEHAVFPAIKDYLPNLKFVFLEYHSRPDRPQALSSMLDLLSQAGFRFDIQNIMSRRHPFVARGSGQTFDLQLNIFAWKP